MGLSTSRKGSFQSLFFVVTTKKQSVEQKNGNKKIQNKTKKYIAQHHI